MFDMTQTIKNIMFLHKNQSTKPHNFTKAIMLVVTLFIHATMLPIVYNFRVAQITRRPINKHNEKPDPKKTPYSFTTLPFVQLQKHYHGDIFERFIGDYNAFVYDFGSSCYFRTDFAFAQIHQKTCNVTTFSEMESDDLLFTVGRNFNPTEKSRVTLSALFGVPTHTNYVLQHLTISPGQIGAGIQLDGLYSLDDHLDFLWGTRYLYFIPVDAQAKNNNFYRFTIGQAADLLIALKSYWPQSHHGIEGGYSAHWNFKAKIWPHVATVVDQTNFIRNSFYLVYKYSFKSEHYAQQVLFNASYGFDSKPKLYGYKWSVMVWASWGINF